MIAKLHLKTFEAASIAGFTLDAEGKLPDLCLMKAAGYSLDEQAVQQFRFKPAVKDGSPGAVRLSIETNFP